MHFNSVDQILSQLERQPGWERFREYRQLLQCWNNTVNRNTAQHTRPLHISRQVLWVATSSAARAQELSFQRYTLLKRLNKQLTFDLKDIRFSSSEWHQASDRPEQNTPPIFNISDRHKSKATLARSPKSNSQSDSASAKQAVRQWLETLKDRNSSIFCPSCNAPTSKEELSRWNICHHCIAQKWSEDYRSATFSESE